MSAGVPQHDEEERREAERHDRLYVEQRPADLRLLPDDWERFDGMTKPLNAYAASVIALGDIRGRNILDMGCGDGWLSVILAKRGANVWGYDISGAAIDIAKQRAAQMGVSDRTHFEVASAYQTSYKDQQFDAVIGQAILHHLGDKDQLSKELLRVMKPGAKAVFCEPFAASEWLKKVRRAVPVKSEAEDDPDQEQLRYSDFDVFKKYFDVRLEEYQLLSRLERLVSAKPFVKLLGRVDRALLGSIPALRKYARTILVTFTKSRAG
jgi:ubiquinone/menaquinone biosynthesis C-methylase UbiE